MFIYTFGTSGLMVKSLAASFYKKKGFEFLDDRRLLSCYYRKPNPVLSRNKRWLIINNTDILINKKENTITNKILLFIKLIIRIII